MTKGTLYWDSKKRIYRKDVENAIKVMDEEYSKNPTQTWITHNIVHEKGKPHFYINGKRYYKYWAMRVIMMMVNSLNYD